MVSNEAKHSKCSACETPNPNGSVKAETATVTETPKFTFGVSKEEKQPVTTEESKAPLASGFGDLMAKPQFERKKQFYSFCFNLKIWLVFKLSKLFLSCLSI